ncbi:MAG: glycogen synthase GlgA [Planctomycetota bacterium]
MVAAEAVPLVKVGGLADVLGALPSELARRGHRLSLVLPGYRDIARERFGFAPLESFWVSFGGVTQQVNVVHATAPSGLEMVLLESTHFDRPGIYGDPTTALGYADSGERFGFFARAVSEWLARSPGAWDVVHVHDYHAALVPAYLRTTFKPVFAAAAPRLLFTIHNIAYQGNFDPELYFRTGLPWELWYPLSPFEFWGKFSFMKAGIAFSDYVSTVSPRYAAEILTPQFGNGLEGVLAERRDRVLGILNGIDTTVWNPADDGKLKSRYDARSLARKADNKIALRLECGLDRQQTGPLIGIISRLVEQKGFDIVAQALPQLVKKGASLVVLGTGSPQYHQLVLDAVKRHPGRVMAFLKFDDDLAHRIEAGADLFLMPSRFEPCGLNQMMSLRYGTPPIVRRTGGLADTVQEFDPATRTGNGFVFDDATPQALLAAFDRALRVFRDPGLWNAIRSNGMQGDYSWAHAAQRYEALYQRMLTQA